MNDETRSLPTASPFPPTSRYANLPTQSLVASDGRTIVYLARRFVPSAARFVLLQLHTVKQGDRLDNIAERYLGDPQAFWRLCDANNAFRPDELTEVPGRQVRITLNEGIPSPRDPNG
jgi:hypothetical protein